MVIYSKSNYLNLLYYTIYITYGWFCSEWTNEAANDRVKTYILNEKNEKKLTYININLLSPYERIIIYWLKCMFDLNSFTCTSFCIWFKGIASPETKSVNHVPSILIVYSYVGELLKRWCLRRLMHSMRRSYPLTSSWNSLN